MRRILRCVPCYFQTLCKYGERPITLKNVILSHHLEFPGQTGTGQWWERLQKVRNRLKDLQNKNTSTVMRKGWVKFGSQADWGSVFEKRDANASLALDDSSRRFFSQSVVISNAVRAPLFFLRSFLFLRVCFNCSCKGESFLISFAFIFASQFQTQQSLVEIKSKWAKSISIALAVWGIHTAITSITEYAL